MAARTHPLVSIVVVVLLSLVVALVLFGVLSSTGLVRSTYGEFGGAAAGFFATLFLVHRWHGRLEARHLDAASLAEQNQRLRETLKKMNVPAFEVPASFEPFVDHEHSMLFCYPAQWRRQPIKLQVQGIFSEDALDLHGDEFPGNFNLVVSSPGQATYSLKATYMMAQQMDIPPWRVEEELGVAPSPMTESLQVPLERILDLFGAKGASRMEQIYEFNYRMVAAVSEASVRREAEIVGGRDSMLLEREVERDQGEALVQFVVVTYVPETDLIFSFTFTDNSSDRDKIDRVRKQVLSTVKFWDSVGPRRSADA